MDKTAIADLSIEKVKSAYAGAPLLSIFFLIVATCLLHPDSPVGGLSVPIMFGFLSRDEMRGLRWKILSRVSTGDQKNNNSTETQIQKVKSVCEELDGKIVDKAKLTESGAATDRDSLEDVVEAGESNEIDILGVSKFDRLTRVSPWDALTYLNRLKNAGVILYVDSHGFFDYEDNIDFRILVEQVLFANNSYRRIIDGAKENQVRDLNDYKYPFGNPGWGFAKDDDGHVYVEEEKKAALVAIFEEYCKHESRAAVKEEIKEQFELDDYPTKAQIKTAHKNRLCIGQFSYKNEIFAEKPDLAVVDNDLFEKVNEIRRERKPDSANAREIPEPVNRAARDFGPEYVIRMIKAIGKQCRKCGSDLRKYATVDKFETTVQKYKCKNEDCGYQGPLLSKNEFEKLHGTLPTRCPWCPATEQFDVRRTANDRFEFVYKCQCCDSSFATDKVEGKAKRAANNPELAFDWFNDSRKDVLDNANGAAEGADQSESSTASQSALTKFSP
jgi:hypothetical protein